MSAPAANAFSLPARRIAPTSGSASNACNAAPSSCISFAFSALSCFGRLSVMQPTRPLRSVTMNSKLMGGDHLGVETVERGEERGVHLARRYRLAAERLRAGGA